MASDNLRGIVLMVLSMAFFAVEDMFLKFAAADLPIGEIVFISGAFGMPIFVVMAWRAGERVLTRDIWHRAVVARNIGEMIATLGYMLGIANLPLSTVSAILQATPLALTMAAALFMGEQVGWRRWTAIFVGFVGVLLVIRPGFGEFGLKHMGVLLVVVGITLRDLASRRIPDRCSTAQVSVWGLTAIAVLGTLMMLISGEAHLPSPWQGAILFGATVFGSIGYWAIIGATRTGEVAAVSPFRYVRLVFAVLIGAFVFAEWPDVTTLLGSGLIVASGLYAFARERARKRALS